MKASRLSSRKAHRVSAMRRELRRGLLEERGPSCEVCPKTPVGSIPPKAWEEMHEVLTRGRGGDPTDAENILCVCRRCHEWITAHNDEATQLGFVRSRTAEEHRALFKVGFTEAQN